MDIETTKLEADATPLIRRASQKVRLQRTHAENGQGGHSAADIMAFHWPSTGGQLCWRQQCP